MSKSQKKRRREAKSLGRRSQAKPLSANLRDAGLVVATALAAYLAALGAESLGDTLPIIVKRLENVEHWTDLGQFFVQSYWGEMFEGGLYRPLALMLFGVQKLIFGVWLPGYHIVSTLLHVACSLVVWRILRQFVVPWAALAGAALFAAHPIHAEAVAVVYGQNDLWAALFFLIALNLGIGWAKSEDAVWRWSVIGLLYFASLLCKESGVLLPMALMLVHGFWIAPQASGVGRWIGWREASLAIPLAVYLAMRMSVLGLVAVPTGLASVIARFPWWSRLTLVVLTLGNYCRLLVLPTGQTTFYGHMRDELVKFPLSALLWLVGSVVVLVFLAKRLRDRRLGVAYGWLVVTLLPVANFLPIGTVVAERCLYLPSVAIVLIVAVCLEAFAKRRPRASQWIAVLLVLVALVGSVLVSWHWQTKVSHWETTAATYPAAPKSHAMLGISLLDEVLGEEGKVRRNDARIGRAEMAILRAYRLDPGMAQARYGRGLLAAVRGDYASGEAWALAALEVMPYYSEAEALLERCRFYQDQ